MKNFMFNYFLLAKSENASDVTKKPAKPRAKKITTDEKPVAKKEVVKKTTKVTKTTTKVVKKKIIVSNDDVAVNNGIENYKSEVNDNSYKIKGVKKSFDYTGGEVILSVRHLKQFFRFGRGAFKYLKAVHDVSFDIFKGEVFGLVGESGCGKTTTGRSIIKLYDVTSGDVVFNNIKITSGTRWNEKEIKFTKIRLRQHLKAARSKYEEELAKLYDEYESLFSRKFSKAAIKNEQLDPQEQGFVNRYNELEQSYNKEKTEIQEHAMKIIVAQREKIKEAKYNNKHFNDGLIEAAVKDVQTEFSHLLVNGKLRTDLTHDEKTNELPKYKQALRTAKRTNVTTKMQMIFQDPIASLNPRMTVRDIISEGLVIKGIRDKDFITKEVNRVLELVGLVPEHSNRYPHEFSGGQRQRIGIARAIIMNPDLIIADEPVSALDVSIQAQVINLLNDLRNELGLTILFIAHNLSVVKYFCDRIAVMYYGKIVELTTSEVLFARPMHPYTISLLSAVPTPDPNAEKSRSRIQYNPATAHDYSKEKPLMREVEPGHFVYCSDSELEAIKTKYNLK